jgi:hypothetical protein
MSRPAHTIDIDRIILTDLDVTPDQAEHIRALIEAELLNLLGREGLPEHLASGGEMAHLIAEPMHMAAAHNDRHLASGVAQHIFRALSAAGRS